MYTLQSCIQLNSDALFFSSKYYGVNKRQLLCRWMLNQCHLVAQSSNARHWITGGGSIMKFQFQKSLKIQMNLVIDHSHARKSSGSPSSDSGGYHTRKRGLNLDWDVQQTHERDSQVTVYLHKWWGTRYRWSTLSLLEARRPEGSLEPPWHHLVPLILLDGHLLNQLDTRNQGDDTFFVCKTPT